MKKKEEKKGSDGKKMSLSSLYRNLDVEMVDIFVIRVY